MSFAENLSFASIEVVPERFIQKDNYHGIGYNPLNPTAALHTKVKQSTSVKGRTKTGSRLSFMGQVIMIAYLFILRQFYSSRQPDRSRFVASPRAYNQDRPQRPKHRSTATKITIEAWTGFLIMLYLFLSRLLNFWKTLLSSVDNVTSPGHWNYFFWKGPQQGCVIKCMEIQSFFDYIESIVT